MTLDGIGFSSARGTAPLDNAGNEVGFRLLQQPDIAGAIVEASFWASPRFRPGTKQNFMESLSFRMQKAASLAAFNRLAAKAEPMVTGGARAVPGEGPAGAAIAFVGEQPGDQEDLAGRPFVGPAGHLFNKALAEAGIDRGQVYVTNAVKHFKFEQRGKRRIHSRPTAGEVKHYRWWLEKELDLVRPRLVVALGAAAALALAGHPLPVARNRGPVLFQGRPGYLTVHPSFLLRMPSEDREEAFRDFASDLKRARKLAGGTGTKPRSTARSAEKMAPK